MSDLVTSRDFYEVLNQFIEFPEGVTEFVIRAATNKLVTIEFVCNAKKGGIPIGGFETKRYNLVEIPNE